MVSDLTLEHNKFYCWIHHHHLKFFSFCIYISAAVCYYNNMSTMCICISYPCFLPCFSKHLNENDCNRSPRKKIERSRKKFPGNFVIADKNRLKIHIFSSREKRCWSVSYGKRRYPSFRNQLQVVTTSHEIVSLYKATYIIISVAI